MWDLSSPTSDSTCAPAWAAWGLNYWIVWEVPIGLFKEQTFEFSFSI